MFGPGREQRRVERERQAVLAAVDYLEASIRDGQNAVDAVVMRVDPMELQAAVVRLAECAIVVLAEARGITPSAAATELGQDLIRAAGAGD